MKFNSESIRIFNKILVSDLEIMESVLTEFETEKTFDIGVLDKEFKLTFKYEQLFDKLEYDNISELIDVVRIDVYINDTLINRYGFSQMDIVNADSTDNVHFMISNLIGCLKERLYRQWYNQNIAKQLYDLDLHDLHEYVSSVLNPFKIGFQFAKDQMVSNVAFFHKKPYQTIIQNNILGQLDKLLDEQLIRQQIGLSLDFVLSNLFREDRFPVTAEIEI